ncbi:MAG: O-antigen polymerase [Ignavibacteriaceae bacterium]|jgi:oligosaccharide repeat unit polymerase
MTIVSFICLVILLSVIASCLNKESDIFSPNRVFIFIWALAIGLADFKFSRFQSQWTLFGWTTLLISLFAFILGIFIVTVININSNIYKIDEIRKKIKNIQLDHTKFFYLILLIFCIYIICFVSVVIIKGFVPILSNHPAESRTQYEVFGIGIFIHSATAIMFFIIQYFILIRNNAFKKFILCFILFITFSTYFSLLQRYDLIFWIVISLIFYFYSKKLRIRVLLPFIIGILSIIYAIQNIRLSKYFAGYLYVFSKMKFNPKFAILTEPYMYIVMNLENFVKGVARIKEHSYGYYSFNFILSLTGLKHWMHDYFYLDDFPFIRSGYNTYTMFWDFYRDFGMLGLTLISFGLGFIICLLYFNFRAKPNVNTLSMYALGVFVMLFSFFINSTGQLHFVFNTCLISLGTLYILKAS